LSSPALDIFNFIFITIAAGVAGFVDSIVGGGGLILVPTLFTAYPSTIPATLLGTNKGASVWGTAFASWAYSRKINLPVKGLLLGAFFAIIGSFTGAWCVTQISATVFKAALPIILLALLIYTLIKKELGQIHAPRFNTRGELIRLSIIGILIGFYGYLNVAYGFSTGWREFGPERKVTRAEGSVVYEIDHRPALEIYTKYLGDLSTELPGSGLRFPLSVTDTSLGRSYVRTLLGINWEELSLSFAGGVPQGSLCKLMKTDIDSLIDASVSLTNNLHHEATKEGSLCLVVSCVGRRLVMDQIAGEEIEAIQSILGAKTTVFGFYSYGEIAPFEPATCALHNQTTTLTLLSE